MTTLPPPRLTTALGGGGFVLAALFPLGTIMIDPMLANPPFDLASWLALALASGVLAFGVPGESDIVGGSTVGRAALFVYGIHHLVLSLSGTFGPSFDSPGVVIGGYVGLGLGILGWVAQAVAAVVVVRARVLHGPARWALVVLAVVDAVGIAMSFVLWGLLSGSPSSIDPIEQGMIEVASVLGRLSVVALAGVGVAYALFGRSPAIRRRLQLINEKW